MTDSNNSKICKDRESATATLALKPEDCSDTIEVDEELICEISYLSEEESSWSDNLSEGEIQIYDDHEYEVDEDDQSEGSGEVTDKWNVLDVSHLPGASDKIGTAGGPDSSTVIVSNDCTSLSKIKKRKRVQETCDIDYEPPNVGEEKIKQMKKKKRNSTTKVSKMDRETEERKWHLVDKKSGFKVFGFQGPSPGYSNIFKDETKELDTFKLFFINDLLKLIVKETNLNYAQSNPGKVFKELTVSELEAFFGMVIMISTKGIRVIEHIWSKRPYFHDAALSSIMPRDRFGWININIHFNSDFGQASVGSNPKKDRLFKLRPIIDSMKEAYRHNYNLSEHISVDITMVKFKGKHSAKQYVPTNKVKRGFKVWTLADSQTGYVYNFDIYMGKSDHNGSNTTPGAIAVESLVTKDLHHRYHRLYCNSFFTSLTLFKDLKKVGMYCCGTVNNDLPGFPKELSKLTERAGKMERGESHIAVHEDGICAYTWKDSVPTYFISSAHSGDLPETVVTRTLNKTGKRGMVPCPQACSDYNKYCGGVNLANQLKAYYAVDRKSRNWEMRLFWHIFDTTITNAYIINQEREKRRELKPSKLLDFRYNLADQLIGNFTSRKLSSHPHKL